MTEETRKQFEQFAADTCEYDITFNPDCDDCRLGLERIIAAYELGEKDGRSAQKEEDDQAATS